MHFTNIKYVQWMLSGSDLLLLRCFLSDGAVQGDTEHILINAASSLQLD